MTVALLHDFFRKCPESATVIHGRWRDADNMDSLLPVARVPRRSKNAVLVVREEFGGVFYKRRGSNSRSATDTVLAALLSIDPSTTECSQRRDVYAVIRVEPNRTFFDLTGKNRQMADRSRTDHRSFFCYGEMFAFPSTLLRGEGVDLPRPPLRQTHSLPRLSPSSQGMVVSDDLSGVIAPHPHPAGEADDGSWVGSLLVEANWLSAVIERRVVRRETSVKGTDNERRLRDDGGRGVCGMNGREGVEPDEAPSHENDKGDSVTRIKCAMATKRKALNWWAVSRHAVCTYTTFKGGLSVSLRTDIPQFVTFGSPLSTPPPPPSQHPGRLGADPWSARVTGPGTGKFLPIPGPACLQVPGESALCPSSLPELTAGPRFYYLIAATFFFLFHGCRQPVPASISLGVVLRLVFLSTGENGVAPEFKGGEKREIPEKTPRDQRHRQGTIPSCENPGVTGPETEPGSPCVGGDQSNR
ncbi:hypothetical protein PR048_008248 [Dryococelus australis]|uniref:Uncharacterized protein n=1 Tax=Dryococelus australis TaxID=614101 RepID=A0ABQ9HXD1_9NEOP|nr:hypothetical protein PR048_008248 [Dryococelus australis]